MADLNHTEWKGNTGGKPWMQVFMAKTFRYIPLCILYWCMGWVIPFYMLFSRQGYHWAFQYFHKHRGYNKLKSFIWVYFNHFRMGQVVIDRFAMYSGKRFKIVQDGQELFNELSEQESGFMQLSSHVGNYELAGYSLVSKNKTFTALVFGGETAQVMDGRKEMFADKRLQMVPVSADLSHIFALNNALAEGNIVSMTGDRIFGSQKHVLCDFMGSKARFPMGPYAMAVQRGVPVLAVFVMKESIHTYHIYVRKIQLPEGVTLKRNEKMAALAQSFAHELELVMDKYPAQWYNYYDFWKQDD